MTLRDNFYGGTGGFDAQIAAAEQAGEDFVGATGNMTTLNSALLAAAAQGKKKFTVTIRTTFNPSALRLQGLLWNAYRDGMVSALLGQVIYSWECNPTLNTGDSLSTSVDFNFTF